MWRKWGCCVVKEKGSGRICGEVEEVGMLWSGKERRGRRGSCVEDVAKEKVEEGKEKQVVRQTGGQAGR